MEYVNFARVILSFGGVVALIFLIAWIAKRLNIEKRLASFKKDARMQVLESCHIDARHKLVLVKRDNQRHVLLIGQGHSTIVESYTEQEEKKESHA